MYSSSKPISTTSSDSSILQGILTSFEMEESHLTVET